jgi:hypothetical protein
MPHLTRLIVAILFIASSAFLSAATPLFNGKDLTGWTIEKNGQFSVSDGLLKVNRGTGWLRSQKTYADYTLVLEVRFLEKGANSGIFVRTGPTSNDDENGWPNNGYQVQCRDTTEGDYPLGGLIPYGAPDFQSTILNAAVNSAYLATGEWNTLEITAHDETISIKLNGIEVCTATEIKNRSGYIGIQGELGLLEFRKIEITTFVK